MYVSIKNELTYCQNVDVWVSHQLSKLDMTEGTNLHQFVNLIGIHCKVRLTWTLMMTYFKQGSAVVKSNILLN